MGPGGSFCVCFGCGPHAVAVVCLWCMGQEPAAALLLRVVCCPAPRTCRLCMGRVCVCMYLYTYVFIYDWRTNVSTAKCWGARGMLAAVGGVAGLGGAALLHVSLLGYTARGGCRVWFTWLGPAAAHHPQRGLHGGAAWRLCAFASCPPPPAGTRGAFWEQQLCSLSHHWRLLRGFRV